MALTLVVELDRWRAHVERSVATRPGLVPVVKGNGYGFGRSRLLDECARLSLERVAVGTGWELDDATATAGAVVVLTPCASPADAAALAPNAVATVATRRDVAVLRSAGCQSAVLVKLRSSLGRYGTSPDELGALLTAIDAAGLRTDGFGIHFPLDTTSAANAAELAAWMRHLPADTAVEVGHVDQADLDALAAQHRHRLRARIGTALWLGDRNAVHLVADVVDVRAVRAGDRIGYRQAAAPADGHLVLVSAGTAHGVVPLDDGRSPFHFARTRLALVEPPHMHTSMLHAPVGPPCPEPGDRVDVQRPLTRTTVDRVEER